MTYFRTAYSPEHYPSQKVPIFIRVLDVDGCSLFGFVVLGCSSAV